MIEVGIIGYGYVGKAVGQLAVKDQIKVIPFDLYQEEYNSPQQMLAAFNCDIVFVCVPTPTDPEDGMIDVSIVLDAACKWNEFSQKDDSVLVIKSTVPPGTTDEIIEYLDNDRIVHNPEFLSQATAMEDFLSLDEIIIGGKEEHCNKVSELYKKWVFNHPDKKPTLRFEDGGHTVYGTPRHCLVDSATAEMIKMARNSFYATKLSFMNEVRDLCYEMKVDYHKFQEVFAYSGNQSWVNPNHTKVPGPDGKLGFGGKCLVKDALGLAVLADTYDVDMPVLKAANKSNQGRRPEAYDEDQKVDDI